MLLAYASKTGNIKRAITKLLDYIKEISQDPSKQKIAINELSTTKETKYLTTIETFEIKTGEELIKKNCILFTYTTGIGEIPQEIDKFIINNINKIKGVICSGNKNWGLNYCKACDLIFEKFNLKTLFKFELAGNTHDIKTLATKIISCNDISINSKNNTIQK
jgi:ribonucleoside-diphosphate reductase protein NrdI